MRNSNANVIRAIASALKDQILPDLKSESTAQTGKFVLALLGMLLSRETTDLIDEEQKKLQALHARMQEIITRHGGAVPSNVNDYTLSFLKSDAYDADHLALLRNQELVRHSAARLVELQQALNNAELSAQLDQLLEEMASNELALTKRYLASLQIAPLPVNPGPAKVTTESLEAYLRDHFPERKNLSVTKVAKPIFSMGKQILIFDIADAPGREESLVMRQEKPVKVWEGEDCTLIKNEYSLMETLYGLGLRVPEPLWLETSGKLGPDFFMMRKAEGDQLGDPFRAFKPLSEDLVMQIAELMARLHGAGIEPFERFLDVTGRKAVLNMSVREATLDRINRYERFFETPNEFPNTAKVWLFDWLKKNVAQNNSRPVMVHGDFGIHNLLAIGDSITACLDWDWAHPGDPLEDLAYIRTHVDKYSNWDRFLQHYVAHGGPKVEFNEKVVSYNGCLSNAIFSSLSTRLAWHVATGSLPDISSVYGANCIALEFQERALASSLAGITSR